MAAVFQELDIAGITTLITAGYPFDHLFEGARPEAAKLNGQLRAAGASRIICFFDDGFTNAGETSREHLELLYRAMLGELIESPSLGLILKPKKPLDETVLASTELQVLLDKAVATGRCLPLARSSPSERLIYPYGPGLAADLAVGYPIRNYIFSAVRSLDFNIQNVLN